MVKHKSSKKQEMKSLEKRAAPLVSSSLLHGASPQQVVAEANALTQEATLNQAVLRDMVVVQDQWTNQIEAHPNQIADFANMPGIKQLVTDEKALQSFINSNQNLLPHTLPDQALGGGTANSFDGNALITNQNAMIPNSGLQAADLQAASNHHPLVENPGNPQAPPLVVTPPLINPVTGEVVPDYLTPSATKLDI